jgi:hypothetical protein
MAPALTELLVGDEPSAWQAAGFTVDGELVRIGDVAVRLLGTDHPRGRGVLGWAMSDVATTDGSTELDLDGIPTSVDTGEVSPVDPTVHLNGVVGFDHVVVITPDLERTIGRFESHGIEARRMRDVGSPDAPRRQVFFWIGQPILELVGPAEPTGDGPSRIYGLALTVDDIDRTAADLGGRVGRVKDAVQPGRRITTLRHKELGLTVPIAFMSTHVKPGDAGA